MPAYRSLTPTTRTVRWLKFEGWQADIVERRIVRWITKDAFGFADVAAFKPTTALILLAQTTSRDNVKSRLKKVFENLIAHEFANLIPGRTLVEVHGWVEKKETAIVQVFRLIPFQGWERPVEHRVPR